jgi:hypothetical protein
MLSGIVDDKKQKGVPCRDTVQTLMDLGDGTPDIVGVSERLQLSVTCFDLQVASSHSAHYLQGFLTPQT